MVNYKFPEIPETTEARQLRALAGNYAIRLPALLALPQPVLLLVFISSHTPVLLAYSNSAFRPQGQKVCGCNYNITKTK